PGRYGRTVTRSPSVSPTGTVGVPGGSTSHWKWTSTPTKAGVDGIVNVTSAGTSCALGKIWALLYVAGKRPSIETFSEHPGTPSGPRSSGSGTPANWLSLTPTIRLIGVVFGAEKDGVSIPRARTLKVPPREGSPSNSTKPSGRQPSPNRVTL